MRSLILVTILAASSCTPEPITHDGGVERDGGTTPSDAGIPPDAGALDRDAQVGVDAGIDAGPSLRWIVFQCAAFAGGICRMREDGSARETLEPAGFSPDSDATGAILFHTSSYELRRRDPDGTVVPLGEGAFGTFAPDGRVVFQCTGLGGGVCRMARDGSAREALLATGRSPHASASGTFLFHTDGYRVAMRTTSTSELGDGAFPRWRADGGIVFQCSGLGGGLCRMSADGSGRTTLSASGRTPDEASDGSIVHHTDGYVIAVRAPDGSIRMLSEGANARWSR